MPYHNALRSLALSYWLGSEYDIALVKKEEGADTSSPLTSIYHDFDALTHTALKAKFGFEWDDAKSYHTNREKVDYLKIIGYLLSYYNGVFFDDTKDKYSLIYFQKDLTEKIPQKINIHHKGENSKIYRQDEMQKYKLESGQTRWSWMQAEE